MTGTQALLARIVRLHEAEVIANRPGMCREDIPISYQAIRTEWLTDVLCRDTQGVYVTALTLGEDDDGTSNRRRIHIEYNDAGRAAGFPQSVFCKASQTLQSRMTLGVLGCTHAEHTFYTQVRPQLTIEAPEPLWANYDPQSFASILMLRDLGQDVEFCDHRSNVTWKRAENMVQLLAGVHGRLYQHPALAALLSLLSPGRNGGLGCRRSEWKNIRAKAFLRRRR